MKIIKINLNIKNLMVKFKTNTALVFYVIFFAILISEVFILYSAVNQIIVSRQASLDIAPARGVRLQFAEYQQAAKRIEAGREFLPGPPLYQNFFGTK